MTTALLTGRKLCGLCFKANSRKRDLSKSVWQTTRCPFQKYTASACGLASFPRKRESRGRAPWGLDARLHGHDILLAQDLRNGHLVYCHINDFQRASRLARPFQGGEKMTAVWASHHEELCSAGVVAPRVHTHMVAPHRWGVLDGGNPLGSAVDASRRPSMGRPLPH